MLVRRCVTLPLDFLSHTVEVLKYSERKIEAKSARGIKLSERLWMIYIHFFRYIRWYVFSITKLNWVDRTWNATNLTFWTSVLYNRKKNWTSMAMNKLRLLWNLFAVRLSPLLSIHFIQPQYHRRSCFFRLLNLPSKSNQLLAGEACMRPKTRNRSKNNSWHWQFFSPCGSA